MIEALLIGFLLTATTSFNLSHIHKPHRSIQSNPLHSNINNTPFTLVGADAPLLSPLLSPFFPNLTTSSPPSPPPSITIYLNTNIHNTANFHEHAHNIKISSYEIAFDKSTLSDSRSLTHLTYNLDRLLTHASSPPSPPGSPSTYNFFGINTFFTSLTAPDVNQLESSIWSKLCLSSDAMELRVDLLSDCNNRWTVLHQMQSIRSLTKAHVVRGDLHMPIVFTVRSMGQAGKWPNDEAGIAAMYEMLEVGLRGGCEVLDVEANWGEKFIGKLLNHHKNAKHATLLLGSFHVVGGEAQINTEEGEKYARMCSLQGSAHCAKLVLSCFDESEAEAGLAKAVCETAVKNIPFCALHLGDEGKSSRVGNDRFTPVSHPDLPFKAAPGQMSSHDIMLARNLSPSRFGILGHNIDYSVSPQMHNAAFQICGLPHFFERYDFETVGEWVDGGGLKRNDFRGASVTIPHKVDIIPHMNWLSEEVGEIGAMNTIVVGEGGKLMGYNTDWIGIFNPVKERLGGRKGKALVCGGGGTARAAAYAAKQLGLELLFWNRTEKKARALADSFGGKVVSGLDADVGQGVVVVLSTLPAAAEFTLPEKVFDENPGLVVLDVNYKPYWTKLLRQAVANECEIIRGSEMLWGQGIEQYELWTGRTAPRSVFRDTVLDNCDVGE